MILNKGTYALSQPIGTIFETKHLVANSARTTHQKSALPTWRAGTPSTIGEACLKRILSPRPVLREGDNRNRWRDGQVCPDVGQGIMAPWARRHGRRGRGALPCREKRKKPCPGSKKHERRALVGTDWKRALKKRTWSEFGVERKER
ncbi:hypothetical protein TNCV_3812171 [Trichonephila clavipes]|nr:hypothetical protein TNCV_3812171 [Trichonephila clavipes]